MGRQSKGGKGKKQSDETSGKGKGKKQSGKSDVSNIDAALLGDGDLEGMPTDDLLEGLERIEDCENTGSLRFDSQADAIASLFEQRRS